MENKEIMVNEEVIEEATEVVADPKKGIKTLVGVGLIIVAGIAAYKIGKKIVTKVKKSKEENARLIEAEFEEVDSDENSTKEV